MNKTPSAVVVFPFAFLLSWYPWVISLIRSSGKRRTKPTRRFSRGNHCDRAHRRATRLKGTLFADVNALGGYCYSILNATTGSTVIARRAGTTIAMNATASSRNGIKAKINGSVGLI
jgi:hypothetical protein